MVVKMGMGWGIENSGCVVRRQNYKYNGKNKQGPSI